MIHHGLSHAQLQSGVLPFYHLKPFVYYYNENSNQQSRRRTLQANKMDDEIIRRSSASQGSREPGCYDERPHHHKTPPDDMENVHSLAVRAAIPVGWDDALSREHEIQLGFEALEKEMHRLQQSVKDTIDQSDHEISFLDVPIPTAPTNNMTTFAHQKALRNRIKDSKFARNAEYDMRAFTPTFIHDCLMLPGSLANVLGKA